jgi:hypothetical protein
VENDQWESVMKLAQAHEMLAKMIHSALHKDLQLSQKLTKLVTKMLYKEMKKRKSESVWGDHVMIAEQLLDNLIHCSHYWWDSEGEDWAGRPRPHPGGLLKEAGGGLRNLMAANFVKALWRRKDQCKKCAKIADSHVDQN